MLNIWIALAVAIYTAGFYNLLATIGKSKPDNKPPGILIWTGCIVLVLIWHSELIVSGLTSWSSDSFYSLNFGQKSGLVVWSALLIFALLWISNLKTGWIKQKVGTSQSRVFWFCLTDVSITLLLFELFYVISPQLYYLYYQIIFPELPTQWVIRLDWNFETSVNRLLMNSTDTFSKLLAGLTIWVLIFNVIWQYLLTRFNRHTRIQLVLCAGGFGFACLLWFAGVEIYAGNPVNH